MRAVKTYRIVKHRRMRKSALRAVAGMGMMRGDF